MKPKPAASEPTPGYPTGVQFAHQARRIGLMATLGATALAMHGCYTTSRTGGVPPRPKHGTYRTLGVPARVSQETQNQQGMIA